VIEFEDLALLDLEIITTLGIGGFGRVELVQVCNNKTDVQFIWSAREKECRV